MTYGHSGKGNDNIVRVPIAFMDSQAHAAKDLIRAATKLTENFQP